jgi:hypothetical protein
MAAARNEGIPMQAKRGRDGSRRRGERSTRSNRLNEVVERTAAGVEKTPGKKIQQAHIPAWGGGTALVSAVGPAMLNPAPWMAPIVA